MIAEKCPAIKTGCLSCHSRGIRCDPSNAHCKQYSSTTWGTNRLVKYACPAATPYPTASLSISWTGTRREKQSLHFFSTYTAPELAGWLDTTFWQYRVLQTSQHDPAIRHVIAALGASHEHRLRKQAARENLETGELDAFAMRQCNKAISDLLRPSEQPLRSLMRALTASVLFACFESANYNREQACVHVLHSRRLLDQIKTAASGSTSQNSYLVSIAHLEPLIAHHETFLDPYFRGADATESNDVLDLLGTPDFSSFSQARVALEGAIARLGVVLMGVEDTKPTAADIANLKRSKATFTTWLRRWEHAFSAFLAREAGNCDAATLNGYRVLKAHQLASTVLADINYAAGEPAWAAFTPRFKAIVELVEGVMQGFPRRSLSSQAPQGPYMSASMGLTEPLYATASRCADPVIAEKARTLLARLPANEGVHSSWRIAFIERVLCACTGKPCLVADTTETQERDFPTATNVTGEPIAA
ncbi:hypothetical protein LTR09_007683 [Extremus antarcticus]|uniref:Uncharacterized protein n=1 Tax=Extremus antarcticus TaxID=702011 RepID=A0AAJ0DCE7_9PEZI|nr:hypothetical protein LTR09_007683 [Extremus antarcticus]